MSASPIRNRFIQLPNYYVPTTLSHRTTNYINYYICYSTHYNTQYPLQYPIPTAIPNTHYNTQYPLQYSVPTAIPNTHYNTQYPLQYPLPTTIPTTGYWASYNIPSYRKMYELTGNADVARRYGPKYSYELAPRAKIFRRDQSKVVDLKSMKDLMRYNS